MPLGLGLSSIMPLGLGLASIMAVGVGLSAIMAVGVGDAAAGAEQAAATARTAAAAVIARGRIFDVASRDMGHTFHEGWVPTVTHARDALMTTAGGRLPRSRWPMVPLSADHQQASAALP